MKEWKIRTDVKIRVSQAEMDAIRRKFQNSGMDTLSGFVCSMIFDGYIVPILLTINEQIYENL